jgi:hypothetical protein
MRDDQFISLLKTLILRRENKMNTFYLRIISLGEIKPTGGRIEKIHYEHTSEISFQYQAADLFTSLIDKLFQLKHENPEMEYHIV